MVLWLVLQTLFDMPLCFTEPSLLQRKMALQHGVRSMCVCAGGCCVCCSVAELSLSKPTLNNSSMPMHSRPHADNAHHGNMCWRMPGLHRQGQLVLAPRFFLLSICLKQTASLRMGGGGYTNAQTVACACLAYYTREIQCGWGCRPTHQQ